MTTVRPCFCASTGNAFISKAGAFALQRVREIPSCLHSTTLFPPARSCKNNCLRYNKVHTCPSPLGVFVLFVLLNEWVLGPIFWLPNHPTTFHGHDRQRCALSRPRQGLGCRDTAASSLIVVCSLLISSCFATRWGSAFHNQLR